MNTEKMDEMKKAEDAGSGAVSEEMAIDEGFAKLEEIIRVLEDRNTPLEQATSSWKYGMEILKVCNEKIDLVDKKVKMLTEEGEIGQL